MWWIAKLENKSVLPVKNRIQALRTLYFTTKNLIILLTQKVTWNSVFMLPLLQVLIDSLAVLREVQNLSSERELKNRWTRYNWWKIRGVTNYLNCIWSKLLLVVETSPDPISYGGALDGARRVAGSAKSCEQTQEELFGQHFLPKQPFPVTARGKSIGQVCVVCCRLDEAALYHQ